MSPLLRPICLAAALGLSACASTPDPDLVCTEAWIDQRADKALTRIEKRASKAIAAVGDVGETWMSGRSPGPIELFRLSKAVDALEDELREGRGVRDLRTLSETCNAPDLVRERIVSLLDRNRVPDRVTSFLIETGLLERMVIIAEGHELPASWS